jgi:hypothetical protein
MSRLVSTILSRRKAQYVVCALLCLTIAIVVGARRRLRNEVTRLVPQSSAQPASQVNEHIEAELVTVTPTGFDPGEIRRGPGPFLLAIENRSGTDLGPLSLVADIAGLPVPVSRIAEARINKENHNYSERLVLLPGRYRLRQQGGAGWSFLITITPN